MLDMLVRKQASLSSCGRYRYQLRRTWDEKLRPYVIGMLNPSTADDEVDDPTIRVCMTRARKLNCGSLIVWNLGALRATDPKLWMRSNCPIGARNDWWIKYTLQECSERNGIAVVAWGNHGTFRERGKVALRALYEAEVQPMCLGVTNNGQPRHPLYVSSNTELRPFTLLK